MTPLESWWEQRPIDADDVNFANLVEWESTGVEQSFTGLIDCDSARSPDAESIRMAGSLTRYSRDLHRFVRSFVSFGSLYSSRQEPIFLAGKLFLDGRRFDLCLPVDHIKSHLELARESRLFLLYCICSKVGAKENRAVVATVTDGYYGNLAVGVKGVFVDAGGSDWQASVTQIVGSPVNLRGALLSPYVKFARLLTNAFQKQPQASQKKSKARPDGSAPNQGGNSNQASASSLVAAAAATRMLVTKLGGRLAAIGLSIGAIGTGIFGEVKFWKQLVGRADHLPCCCAISRDFVGLFSPILVQTQQTEPGSSSGSLGMANKPCHETENPDEASPDRKSKTPKAQFIQTRVT